MDITKLKAENNKDKVLDFLYDNRTIISKKLGFNILKRMERDETTKGDNAIIFSYIHEDIGRVFLITSVGSLMITIENLRENTMLLEIYLNGLTQIPDDIKRSLIDCFAEAIMRETRIMEEQLYLKLKQLSGLLTSKK
jgi:hypothetical protein